MNVPKVTVAQAQQFARTWTCDGVAVILDAVHCRFAADLANAAVLGFVQQYARELLEAQKPKVVIAE